MDFKPQKDNGIDDFGPFWTTFRHKMEPVLAPFWSTFGTVFGPLSGGESCRNTRNSKGFRTFLLSEGVRFGSLFGPISGPFLVHFWSILVDFRKSTRFSSSGKIFRPPAEA